MTPFRAVHHLAALRIGFLCRAWGGFLCSWVQQEWRFCLVHIDFHGHVMARWRQPRLGNLVTWAKQLSRCSWSPCALREKSITHSLGLLQYLGVLTVYGYAQMWGGFSAFLVRGDEDEKAFIVCNWSVVMWCFRCSVWLQCTWCWALATASLSAMALHFHFLPFSLSYSASSSPPLPPYRCFWESLATIFIE